MNQEEQKPIEQKEGDAPIYQITQEKELNYPFSQTIENIKSIVEAKFIEAKNAVEKHRQEYPNDNRKYMFSTFKKEETNKIIDFGYVAVIGLKKEDNADNNEVLKSMVYSALNTSGGYKPILI